MKRPFDLSYPVMLGVVVLLAAMIVLPVGWLVVYAFADKEGHPTLANFATLFTDSSFLEPLVTTLDRKSTRLNSSHSQQSRMPSSA